MSQKIYTKQTIYGHIQSDSPPKNILLRFKLAPIVCGLISAIGAFFASYFIDFDAPYLDGGSIFFIILGTVLFISGPLLFLYNIRSKKRFIAEYNEFMEDVRQKQKKEEEAAKKHQKEHPYPEAENFFKQARKAGIPNLDSEANVSRLLLFAQKKNITTTQDELIEQFNLGRQYVEEHETQKRLTAAIKNEKALLKQCTLYSNYTDKGKSIQICKDEIRKAKKIISHCKQDENSINEGGVAKYMNARQKESSWELQGGIASGIAGSGAGLAVAADVQRRNQTIRQNNEQLLDNITRLTLLQLEDVWAIKRDAEKDLSYWTAELKKSEMLLFENLNEKDLLTMLHPSVNEFQITETGAVKLNVELHPADNLIIFDKVKAVVDGSIKVILKVGDEVVGSAVCDLPYNGVSYYTIRNAICCNPEKKAQKYTFDFEPNHLWAVEEKNDYNV